MNPKVDFYFVKAKKWQKELEQLRKTCLDCGLTEELKWGVPCYTFEKSNIVLIHAFKDYCALLFFKGVLLKDIIDKAVIDMPAPKLLSEIYITCVATDNYKVVFSWNELYNTDIGNHVIDVIELIEIHRI